VNIPNLLTILRIVFVPVIVILLIQGQYGKGLVCLAVAGITDGLDGFLARRWNQKTAIGAFLDPIADKTLVISVFATLGVIGLVPAWLSVVVISRDCMILGGILVLMLLSIPLEVKPSAVSKMTTFLQLVTLVTALLVKVNGAGKPPVQETFTVLLWLTAAFTVVSGVDYLRKGLDLLNKGQKKQGEV